MTHLTLTHPTDDQLNAAFAEQVAGWTHVDLGNDCFIWKHPRPSDGELSIYPLEAFTRSMDNVLPFLEKAGMYISIRYWDGEFAKPTGWHISLWEDDEAGRRIGDYGTDVSLPRACVIALLRANGVEVVT